jgi:hypothetical protein
MRASCAYSLSFSMLGSGIVGPVGIASMMGQPRHCRPSRTMTPALSGRITSSMGLFGCSQPQMKLVQGSWGRLS